MLGVIPAMTSSTQGIAGMSMVSCGSGLTKPAQRRHPALEGVAMMEV